MTRKVEDFLFVAYPLVSKTVLRVALSNGCIIGESPASKATKFGGNEIRLDVGVLLCSLQEQPHYSIGIRLKRSSTRA